MPKRSLPKGYRVSCHLPAHGVALLRPENVLVTIGTPCSLSAVGTTQTYLALVANAPEFIALAAFDAGLVDLAPNANGSVTASWQPGDNAAFDDIEQKHGRRLRANLGIRFIDELSGFGDGVVTDIAASLPHDLADGGLRRLAGLTFRDIRDSPLKDMYGLFDDDPRLGPSLQAQLFAYAGLGALAALPKPLSSLLPDPYDFRVVAGAAFQGLDSLAELRGVDVLGISGEVVRDTFAVRLAASLTSHGPALISTMLAPSYPLGRSSKNPALLETLRSASGMSRVPQTPLNVIGACAASLIALCEIAPQMLFDYPGYRRPNMVLWTAADAGLRPHWALLDAFGPSALATRTKLDAVNAGRSPTEQRPVAQALAPFDVDASGTVIGEGGSGLLITTLDFALRNHLDITSIIVGWGQSAEAGGKAHFAGVGFGGENALVHALDLAWLGHGYGVNDFGYLVAHATGTRTNSKTDLATAAVALDVAAQRQGYRGAPKTIVVGTPKAVGDGHTMGETGLKSVSQAIQYLLGRPAVGAPTLRRLDPELGPAAERFELAAAPVRGNVDGGALCATQGFGGYNAAVALRSANAEAFSRYNPDPVVLSDYLERWPEIRRDREQRELRTRVTRGSSLNLAMTHQWHGV